MASLIQFIMTIVGASIIGVQLSNPMLGIGIWCLAYALMPYYPRNK